MMAFVSSCYSRCVCVWKVMTWSRSIPWSYLLSTSYSCHPRHYFCGTFCRPDHCCANWDRLERESCIVKIFTIFFIFFIVLAIIIICSNNIAVYNCWNLEVWWHLHNKVSICAVNYPACQMYLFRVKRGKDHPISHSKQQDLVQILPFRYKF